VDESGVEMVEPRKNILVVDDEPMICKSCKEILEEDGHHVELAFSGQDGLRKAFETRFDLFILDYKLPDFSGLSFLKKVKSEQKEIPVIMISAYSTVDIVIEAMKLGVSDFIPKPFTPNELSAVVTSAFSERETGMERIQDGKIIDKEAVRKVLSKLKS
jgi:DNA-binding NtrC family response regulator